MQSQTIFRKPIRLFLVLTSLLLSCSTGVSGESSELVAPKVTFQCQTPIDVGDGTVVKIAGDFNAWNPLDESYALTPIDARNHTITLDFEVSLVGTAIEYKYVLLFDDQDDNDWTYVEGNLSGGEIGNRRHTLISGEQTVNDTILTFKNNTGKTSVTRGTLQKVTLDMPQYDDGRKRTIRIWLPEGYDPEDTTTRYPVLYMHDGQNLFDTYTAFSGEWCVDEAMGALMDDGYGGSIVVGIDNSSDRLNELSPSWTRSSEGTVAITNPSGEKYAEFIVNTVKPYIDSHFHTNPDVEATGIGGSSMGGVMSLFMTLTYPWTFGYAMIFSAAMWVYEEGTTEAFIGSQGYVTGHTWPKLYIYAGGSGGEASITPYVALIHDTLITNEYSPDAIATMVDLSRGHNENAWSYYFPIAYQWLVGI